MTCGWTKHWTAVGQRWTNLGLTDCGSWRRILAEEFGPGQSSASPVVSPSLSCRKDTVVHSVQPFCEVQGATLAVPEMTIDLG